MIGTPFFRLAAFLAAAAIDFAVCAAPAPAALDVVVGDSRVVQNQPLTDCNTRAQSALTAVLQRPIEAGDGTGEWGALTKVEAPATPPEAGSIHCFPIGNGYLVTFECAVEIPPATQSAADLCTKLSAAFDAKQAASLTTTGGAR